MQASRKVHPRPPERSSRQLRRWAMRLLGPLLLLGLAGVTGVALTRGMEEGDLPLRGWHLSGALHPLVRRQVEERLASFKGRHFVVLSVDEVKQAVEHIPWVKRVRVRKVWPDSLALEVLEQRAVARWGEDGLLNEEADIFRPTPGTFPRGLVRLEGPVSRAAELLRTYGALRGRFAPFGLTLERLRADSRGAWSVKLEDGPLLRLGSGHWTSGLKRLLKVFGTTLAHQGGWMLAIDLRYANGFAVHWRPGRSLRERLSATAAHAAGVTNVAGVL